jgi:hypothetical protein
MLGKPRGVVSLACPLNILKRSIMNANPFPEPTEQDVQKEAYLLYIASGCAAGRDLENWLAARARLLADRSTGQGDRVISAEIPHLHFPLNANVSRSPFSSETLISSHN